MTIAYHNTNGEQGQELKASNIKAITQEVQILDFFKAFKRLSPSQVYKLLGNPPITSVRRAISNLTYAGKLNKTAEHKIGMYGRREYIWELVIN